MTIEINGTEKSFLTDTASPVTKKPSKGGKMKNKKTSPMNRMYQDVNMNKEIFLGKITVEAKIGGNKKTFNMLITGREDIKPFLAENSKEKLFELN